MNDFFTQQQIFQIFLDRKEVSILRKKSYPVAQKHYATMSSQAKDSKKRRAYFRNYRNAGGTKTMKELTGYSYRSK